MFSRNNKSLDEMLKQAENDASAMEYQDYKSIIHASNDTDEVKYGTPEQTPKVIDVIGTPIQDNEIQAQDYNSGEYKIETENIKEDIEDTEDIDNTDIVGYTEDIDIEENENSNIIEDSNIIEEDVITTLENDENNDFSDMESELELENNFTIENDIENDILINNEIEEDITDNITDAENIITENITDNLETQERQEEEIENISVHPTVTEDKTLTVQSISNIVKMLDLYRTYEDKTQTICKQFLDIEDSCNDTTLDINAVVIYNILNIDKTKKTGLDDLVKLKEEERTSRAFSLIALDNSRLLPLKDITEMFNPGYTNSFDISDKINFCKELESGIDSLNDNALIHLKPINELLRTVE